MPVFIHKANNSSNTFSMLSYRIQRHEIGVDEFGHISNILGSVTIDDSLVVTGAISDDNSDVAINDNLDVSNTVLMGYERVSNTCGGEVSCTVSCTPDKKVIGGGIDCPDGYNVVDSYPGGDSSWTGRCNHIGVGVYAICARIGD